MPKRSILPTEEQEQVTLFEWAAWQANAYPELHGLVAIPNGGLRHIVVAAKLRRQGVKAGFPDIILPVARGDFIGLAIELKRQQGGNMTTAQRWWLDFLRQHGWETAVCNGCDEAITTIMRYLRLERKRGK